MAVSGHELDAATWKRRLAMGGGALLIPPLLSAVLIRHARTDLSREPNPPATSKGREVPPPAGGASRKPAPSLVAPRCTRVVPGFFTLRPGAIQELTAVFEGSPGITRFTWSATGGTLGEGGAAPTMPTIDGFVVADDFKGDTIDEALWRPVVPPGSTLLQANGALTMKLPGGGAHDQVIRLESKIPFGGNFAAEVRIVSVKADGIRGTGVLSFLTDDGFAPHVQRISETAVFTVEENTRAPDGRWSGATSIFDDGRPVKVRLLRGGGAIGFQMEAPGEVVRLGRDWQPISAADGKVVLGAWSLDNAPAVSAVFENFGAAKNVSVAWRAPADAPVDMLYTINVDACHTSVRITEH